MSRIRPMLLALLLSHGLAARAQEAAPPPAQQEAPATVFSFGRENPLCAEWTNGCQVCSRPASGEMQCSTPGIACTPGPPICRVKKEP